MKQSPEEYFQGQEFSLEGGRSGDGFTSAEKAFLEKYLGLDAAPALKELGLEPPKPAPAPRPAPVAAPAPAAPAPKPDPAPAPAPAPKPAPAPAPAPRPAPVAAPAPAAPAPRPEPARAPVPAPEAREPEDEEKVVTLEEELKDAAELQMVSFFLGDQEFVVPINVVQEVVRYMQPTRLPEAPSFLSGIVNLRGRVTPLVRLRELVGVEMEPGQEDNFIVVVRRRGLQLGLQIQRVATMYRAPRRSIEWGIESQLGINVEYVSGLMKSEDGERLIGVISVDRVVDKVLKS